MNKVKQQKRSLLVALLLLFMLAGFNQAVYAQGGSIRQGQSVSISTTEDGKVKLKVIKREGNDETTFEKTYDSHEDMQNDPDLEKYGIDLSTSFSFGGRSSATPKFFLHNGPGSSFWDDDDFDVDSLRNNLGSMMKGFGPNVFSFGFGNDEFMDMDSLVRRFSFKNDNGRFFFNDDEFQDIDSLRDMLKNQFGNMTFDFDTDDDDNGSFRTFRFGDDDSDVKVISRIKVFVRSAKEEDKEVAGTENMESLELRDINFYPNPSDGRFDVELETGSDATIRIAIIDPNGNEVYNRNGTPSDGQYNFRVDLSSERPGIYIMKVIQNNKALTKRVIIE